METAYIDKHLALVEACRSGCRKSQFELYKLYERAMYNVALRIVNHEAEAEDVLQDSFLDAFTRLNAFRSETTFGLWLKQIVVNKSINCLRRRKAEFVGLEGVEAVDIPEADEGDFKWRVEEIRAAVKLLPDGYRVVLTLYLFEGYDHEEISHILKISEVTSRSQFLRAKTKLKQILVQKGVRDEY